MTTAYTSLLGLALPVTGELSGTWGDTVNNSITSLLDSAIAGTTTITVDADTTLSITQGSANTARMAILLWTAGGTATRTIFAPNQSKIYTVINASSGTQSIILAGVSPVTTGVTIAKGESALCAWNGSDFIKISNTAGPGTFTNLTVTGNTSLGDADTDTITQAASYVTGTQLKSAKTATNTLSLAAYDVDGTAYTNLITLTASNTPTLALTSTGVGTINNMSIGATTASTGAFTTLSASGAVTLSGGTENGVAYLNGSKVLTTGSALSFDGTTFSGTTNAALGKNSGAAWVSIGDNNLGNSALRLFGGSTQKGWQIGSNITAANALEFSLATAGGGTTFTDQQMILTSTGLGIGTSSPSTAGGKLTVQASGTYTVSAWNATAVAANVGATYFMHGGVDANNLGFIGAYFTGSTTTAGGYLTLGTRDVAGSTSEKVRIDASGNLLVGNTAQSGTANRVAVFSANKFGLSIIDTTAQATGVGGALNLGGNYRSAGDAQAFARIAAVKENSTDANYAYGMAFSTTPNGGTFVEAGRFDSSGRLLVNSTSLLDYSTIGYSGRVQIAQSGNAQLVCAGFASGADYGGEIILSKSNSNTIGTNSIVQNNDKLGTIFFAGANGTGYSFAAHIRCLVDGTPGASADMPGALLFSTSSDGSATPTERMRLDRRGNLGLGVTPSAFGATYRAFQATGYAAYVGDGNRGHADMLNNAYVSADLVFNYYDTNSAGRYSQQLGGHYWYIAGSGSANSVISWGDPKMSIDTSGNLLVGATSQGTTEKLHVSSATTEVARFTNSVNTSGYSGIRVVVGASDTSTWHFRGETRGVSNWYLYGNGTTSYSSDSRLKKNIETTRDGYLNDLMQLRVVKYNWINSQDTTPKELGLIAQEVEQVFPNLVQEHDIEGVDGQRKHIKHSVMEFILIKAIQELKAEFDAYKASHP